MVPVIRALLRHTRASRRAAIAILSAVLALVLLAVGGLAIDLGHVFLVRTQLQTAADAAATAGASALGKSFEEVCHNAQLYAQRNRAAGQAVTLQQQDVELGIWDAGTRSFTPRAEGGNAVRVTARREASSDQPAFFFGRLWGRFAFSRQASAVALATPRDIAFVVALSGSMNDDTEPCWATDALNQTFSGAGHANVGNQVMQQVYNDFDFGPYPGTSEYVGQSFGVAQDPWAYAELTKDQGPLAEMTVATQYRIEPSDSEAARKRKAYAAIIDLQIARLMPAAKPAPNNASNYAYWEKYLDYLLEPVTVGKNTTNGTPPKRRGALPPDQASDRITGFNNPNPGSFPALSPSAPQAFRNQIGYRSYVQFMMDHGRDLKVAGASYTPLSHHSAECPWRLEPTAGGVFRFPPREQPAHAARRALIAALEVVRERNEGIADPNQTDWVSIVTFDTLSNGGPVVEQPLAGDYAAAMQACAGLQAVGDKGASRATEAGLIQARDLLKPQREGGQGRSSTNKVVILLTDGAPNLCTREATEISQFIGNHPSPEFYGNGASAYDAALIVVAQMREKNWSIYPVGLGQGTDSEFLDRLARLGGTADETGHSPRGSGNPAEYERRLVEIFRTIVTDPQVRLVQ